MSTGRCRTCANRSRNRGATVCPDCAGWKAGHATRCRACSDRFRTERHKRALACTGCGQSRRGHNRPKSGLCRACWRAEKNLATTCPICGGQKSCGKVKTCLACYQAGKHIGDTRAGVLVKFSAAWFRSLLERAGWDLETLAVYSGLSSATLCRWRAGVSRPRVVEWHMVAKVLELDECAHCGGSGTVEMVEKLNPSVRKVGRVEKAAIERNRHRDYQRARRAAERKAAG